MNSIIRTFLGMCLCVGVAASTGPASAQLPPGMKPYETHKVADGVYTFRFFFHRNMFIVTKDGVIATDPINPKAAKIMMGEIRKVTKLPVKYVIYSHEHWDHISGGKVFKDAGATFVSHANCVRYFKGNPNPAVVTPGKPYKGSRHNVTLGGRTVELHHFGRSHGDCMTVMRLPKEKMLFIVDIVTPNRVAFRGMPDFYPREWIRTLKEVEKLDFVKNHPGPRAADRATLGSHRPAGVSPGLSWLAVKGGAREDPQPRQSQSDGEATEIQELGILQAVAADECRAHLSLLSHGPLIAV